MTVGYAADAAAEIKAGRPEKYFDYIELTYGDAFRAGTADAMQTFVLLWQQISGFGNEASTKQFVDRFVPMLPLDARRKIINEYLEARQMPPGDRM
jgi:hypothetical protein